MVAIELIVLGKLKDKYFVEAIKEYEKRLSRYASVKTYEIKPVKMSENPSEKEIENSLSKEADMIEEKLKKNAYIIPLCIEGKQISSEGLSEEIRRVGVSGYQCIQFIIGSSHGLADSIKNRANFKLSFSKMTFPHGLMRVILMEQIYRAFTILENGKYHK